MSGAIGPQLDAFSCREAAISEPSWLSGARKAAIDRFSDLGFPTRKDEAWRFSDLRALTAEAILPAPAAGGAGELTEADLNLCAAPTHRIVLVGGRFVPALSDIGTLPKGAWLGSTEEALAAHLPLLETALAPGDGIEAFAALNTALFGSGFVLALDPHVALDKPVEIVHIATAPQLQAFHLRNAIILGAGAKADVIETYGGSGAGWTNVVTNLVLDDEAKLRHVKIQREADEAFHIALSRADLGRGASYDSFTALLGACLSRQDFRVNLNGEGARLGLHGAYLLHGDQEATFAPFVDHRAPNCRTDKVVKGVMRDNSHGVFLGTIMVRPGADGTDAHQLNRNLLLSDHASIDAKPELTILADDVKCSHGATVGDLDEAALFYLAARGIEPDIARRMLIDAFVGDAIDAAGLDFLLADHVRQAVAAWLDRAGGMA